MTLDNIKQVKYLFVRVAIFSFILGFLLAEIIYK